MDRRRAESAYFQYAILKVVSWYPNMFDISNLALHGDLQDVLPKVTEVYHGVFMSTYARKYIPCLNTGIGSMGAPGAGAPMKFLSGTHTKSHFTLIPNYFLC